MRDEYNTSFKKKFLKKIKYLFRLNFSFLFLTLYCSPPTISPRSFHLPIEYPRESERLKLIIVK